MVQLSTSRKAFSELVSINGIGEKIVESLRSFFAEERNVEMLNDLASYLKILPVDNNKHSSVLSGKVVVFTDSLLTTNRTEAKVRAESLGAKVASNISSNTNFLIVGENPGSKYQKALELGIRILSEEEWLKMVS